jgi:PhnB protein
MLPSVDGKGATVLPYTVIGGITAYYTGDFLDAFSSVPGGCQSRRVMGIQPELWVDHAGEAVAFYRDAFGARLLHRVGQGDDIVAQLAVGDSPFWVASADADMGRLSPVAISGATSRTLLVTDDPETFVRRAVDAGAVELSPVSDEHGWRLGRIRDPFGHEWEIGKPLGIWPPADQADGPGR